MFSSQFLLNSTRNHILQINQLNNAVPFQKLNQFFFHTKPAHFLLGNIRSFRFSRASSTQTVQFEERKLYDYELHSKITKYNKDLSQLIRNKNLSAAEKLFRSMIEKSEYDAVTKAIMIKHYFSARNHGAIKEINNMFVNSKLLESKQHLDETKDEAKQKVSIPQYLEDIYWWAYVHPNAVTIFENEFIVNLILWGNYARLRDNALNELGQGTIKGNTLQIACVYGNLTPYIVSRLDSTGRLDVVDILPVQLSNLFDKLPFNDRVRLIQTDSSSLSFADATYDQVLCFFLLHEQPESVRRGTLAEALRVVKPGGKVIVFDYHKPASWHPLRLMMKQIFTRLEPFALDLWRNDIQDFLPDGIQLKSIEKETFFGGLYQKVIIRV